MVLLFSFLKTTNSVIPHNRGDRLRQIGPIGLRPALLFVFYGNIGYSNAPHCKFIGALSCFSCYC
jgi:hypothetical protein